MEKKEYLQALSASLKGREEILFAYAHGSFLEEGPFRDLDIAVFLRPEAMPASRFHYEDRMAAELTEAVKPSFPLDIRIMNGAPIAFQYRAFRGRLLMERDEDLRIEVLAYIVGRYLDIKPILEHHLKEAFCNDTGS